ncbi:MAG: diguanylate cyclase domain-containing protein [Acidimicrobiales bacterium]
MSEVVIKADPAAGAVDPASMERLLTMAADVTVLIDAPTGQTVRRWYDPVHSKLPLGAPETRIITWVHPDDLPGILDILAHVAREGGTRSTSVRIHPDRDQLADRSLLLSIHNVDSAVAGGLLIQAWLVDIDITAAVDADTAGDMSSLAASVPVGLQLRSANGSVTFENERFTALAAAARAEIDALVEKGLTGTTELVEDIDVAGQSLRLRVVPNVDGHDRLVLGVVSLEDVTGLRVAEAAQAAAEGLFRAVFDGSPAATAIVDLDGRFAQVNEAFAMILGYAPDDLVGRHFGDFTHPDDLAVDQELLDEVVAGSRGGYQMEKRYLHRSGHDVWAELTVAAVRGVDGEISHFVSTVEDITARKVALGLGDSAGDLAYWATHDHLTGLPNRRYLDNHLATRLTAGRRAEDRLVVMFLDLDDFKPVNDRYGHQVGDEVLRTVARRLRNTSRQDEIVARYGGDEFVIVTGALRTAPDVSLLVERILSAVRTPVVGVAEDAIVVGASIGIGIASPGDGAMEVLRRADAAAYRAKGDGKNRAHYSTVS